jgi:hypothetical protein
MAAIIDPKRVGELLRAIEGYKGMPITRAALQLAPSSSFARVSCARLSGSSSI